MNGPTPTNNISAYTWPRAVSHAVPVTAGGACLPYLSLRDEVQQAWHNAWPDRSGQEPPQFNLSEPWAFHLPLGRKTSTSLYARIK